MNEVLKVNTPQNRDRPTVKHNAVIKLQLACISDLPHRLLTEASFIAVPTNLGNATVATEG